MPINSKPFCSSMHPIQERTIDNFLSVSLIVLREVYYPIIREIVIVLFFYLERGCNFSSTQWKYFSSLVLDFFHIFLRVFRIKILLAILKDVEKVCKTKQKKSESTASSSWRISRAWGRETLCHQLLCAYATESNIDAWQINKGSISIIASHANNSKKPEKTYSPKSW